MFKFADGRKLPPGFRSLRKGNEGARSEMATLGEELDGQENVAKTNVKAKKAPKEGYVRADTLEKPKLKKYVKALAQEAKLVRNARKE